MSKFFILFFILNSNFKRDEVVVIFEKGLERDIISSVENLGYKVSYISEYLPFFTVKFNPAKENIEQVIEKLKKFPGVRKVTRNAILKPFATPNDPLYTYQWHFQKIGMGTAWNYGFGSSTVKIAVLDDGFAYRTAPIPSHEQNEVISSDGNYHQAPDLQGLNIAATYDFYHNDNYPDPSSPHGTHVLGTVAQTTNNSYGVAGIAPDVSIILVQVLGPGGGSASQIADGVSFAIQNGAKVINMSLGGPPGDSTGMDVLHLAIKNAYEQGVLIICAAGNDGVSELSYPAGYKECVAVGATDYFDSLTWYSQFGQGIEIVAPGGDLNADWNNDGYADGILQNTCYESGGLPKVDSFAFFFYQGTSMASPHVTGVAALCLSQDPQLSNLDLRRILTGTTIDLGESGYDTVYGFGRLDAANAVTLASLNQYIVYPGDADANGVVNEMDVLPIGLYFGIQGPARNQGDNWEPQFSDKWSPRMATFADCNGDGIINEQDVLTIGKNFGLSHTNYYFSSSFNVDIPEFYENKTFFYYIFETTENKEIKRFLAEILDIRYSEKEKISIFKRNIDSGIKDLKIFDVTGRKIEISGLKIPEKYKGIFFMVYKRNGEVFKTKRIIVK